MATLPRLVLFYVIFMLKNYKVKSDPIKPQNILQTKTFHSNNGLVGVASVAEITSRNGRVSSVGGVNFFPDTDAKSKDMLKNSKDMQPWTFSKKTDDGFTMGAVQVYPGSVVSSVTSVGNPKNQDLGPPGEINPMIHWPAINTILPQPGISPRSNLNPMFDKNFFKSTDPMIPDFGNMWFYPSYNPFLNVW